MNVPIDRPQGSAFAPEVRRALPWLVAQRLVLNTAGRMVFTFLGPIARGTGLGVERMGWALFARDMTGLLGPAIGRASTILGSWRTMVISGLFGAVGVLLMLMGIPGVILGLVLWGLCRAGYTVAMNAWLGAVVAYERRARASGMLELTWAGAALIGLPVMGVLINQIGWWAAPMTLGLIGVPVSALMHRFPAPGGAPISPVTARGSFSRNTWSALFAYALLTAGAQFLWFSHGLWLEETYDFDPAQVGFAILAVGGAEAVASFGTSRVTDQLGKRQAMLIGALVLAVAMAGFAVWPAPPLAIGLGLLAVAFLGFEFAVVSSLPLVTELEPAARAQVLGRSVGMGTVARAAVSLFASWLYVRHGFRPTAIAGATVTGISAAIIAVLVTEPDGDPTALAEI